MNKKLLAVVLLLSFILLSGIVAIIAVDASNRAAARDRTLKYEEETRQLRVEKAELISKLVGVEAEVVGTDVKYRANLSMIFLGVSDRLYYELFPVMFSTEPGKNITGIVCLSAEELPGLDDKITVAQYNELLESGWSTALYWQGCDVKTDGNFQIIDTVAELRAYLDEMRELLDERGIDFPDTLVFKDNNTYSYTKMDSVLAEYGIKYAVHNNEERLALIEQDTTSETGVLHPGAIGWQVEWLNGVPYGKNIFIDDLVNIGGCAAFTVSFFPVSHSSYSKSHYYGATTSEQNSFAKMIEYIRSRVADDDLLVCSAEQSFVNREIYFNIKEAVSEEIDSKKAAIEEQISDVDAQIREIADKYRM